MSTDRLAPFHLEDNNDVVVVPRFFSNIKGIFPLFGFVVVVDMLLTFFVDLVNLADVDEDGLFLDIDFGWNER